ncbi:MAG: DUF3047 domain-containing protein [Desulfotignum sp.]|nr:DUF3047 domain-containing protein [Desulfobacteraceae bacterium]
MHFFLIFGMIFFLCIGNDTTSANQWKIGNFSDLTPGTNLPDPWEPMTFKNIDRHTSYTLIKDNDQTIIRAHSQNSASGLIHPLRVNPTEYPVIKWHWKIDHVLEKGNVTAKQGDDYAARIYVAFAFDPDSAGWWERARHKSASLFSGKEVPGTALNYIWANKASIGKIVPNPYAEEAMMVVLQSGNEASGRWITEERNIPEDYRRAFGKNPPDIIGIGIMTDTDDTGGETTGFYGDITLLPLPD